MHTHMELKDVKAGWVLSLPWERTDRAKTKVMVNFTVVAVARQKSMMRLLVRPTENVEQCSLNYRREYEYASPVKTRVMVLSQASVEEKKVKRKPSGKRRKNG